APINMLLEILSKCPRYFNQGPAIEMWSVVHLPFALMSSFRPFRSVPSHGANGSNSCKRSEVGDTSTVRLEPSSAGAWYTASSTAKPLVGHSSPEGGSNFTCSPFLFVNVSVTGLNPKSPAMAIAATISGEVTNANVFGLPSARFAKLRLKECTIVFFSSFSAPARSHIPIHGPH